VETLMKKGCIGGEKKTYQYALMALFVVIAFVITFYYHSVAQTGVIFTHLFYIPIVLASICWGRKGVWVSVFLAVMLLCSHAVFLEGVSFTEDIIRAVMFVVVGGVVGWLMEDVKKVRELFNKR